MGSILIPTSAREDRVLAYALAKENTARAEAGQPVLTLAEFMRRGFLRVYADKVTSFDKAEADAILAAYRTSDDLAQTLVRDTLKVII